MGMVTNRSHARRGRIDVTPLVDIVLVLLILFLLLTPMRMKFLSVEVPREPTGAELPSPPPLKVSVRADGSITITDKHEVIEAYRIELAAKLAPRLEAQTLDRSVLVDLDHALPYGEAVSAIDTIRGVGASSIALATNTPPPRE